MNKEELTSGIILDSNYIEESAETVTAQNVTDGNQEQFKKGLLAYQKNHFEEAFEIFKGLAEQEEEKAQYMISNMYLKGEGVIKNYERAEFWMKKAADLGDATAQLDYAILQLSENDGNEKKVSEGIKYLEMASDQGEKQALIKYIEIARKKMNDKRMSEKALSYCDQLKELSNDSYEMKGYDDLKEELNSLRKNVVSVESQNALASILTAVGALFLFTASLYIFGGIHPAMWDTNVILKQLPAAGSKLVIGIPAYWTFAETYMDINGMFGLELLVIAWILLCAGKNDLKFKVSKIIEKIFGYFTFFVIIWHFVMMALEGQSNTEIFGWQIGLIFISLFIGTIIGKVLGKLLKTNSKGMKS